MIRVWVMAALMLAAAGSARAGVAEWYCNESETMFISDHGIGFNEHTMCEVDNLPVRMGADGGWTSGITCRNVYVISASGDEPVITHEIPVDGFTQISLRRADDGSMTMTNDLNDFATSYMPCD